MGRRRTFDESEAVTAAATLFRRRGYEATSVDDLVTATGVHRASLYSTFGSKYGLFRRALDRELAPGQGPPGTTADPAEDRLDLALVALLELAPADDSVRTVLTTAVRSGDLTPELLGARLLRRAGVVP